MRTRPVPVDESSDEGPGGHLRITVPRVGRVVELDAKRRVLVEFEGCAGPTPVRLAIEVDTPRLRKAIATKQAAVLVFEEGDSRRPILVGLLAAPVEQLPRGPAGPEGMSMLPAPPERQRAAWVVEADVDGQRVRITGKDEIVLECGKASVTLRRNGKVIIRGTHVETNSSGTNRIKGGQVRIN